jgi:hypothetical protein
MTHHKVILSAAFYIAGLYLYGDLISDFQERMGVILLLGSTPLEIKEQKGGQVQNSTLLKS